MYLCQNLKVFIPFFIYPPILFITAVDLTIHALLISLEIIWLIHMVEVAT